MIRVLIGDDHALVRQGLRQLLSTAADIELVAEAKDGGQVIDLVRSHDASLLLLDLNMPGTSGVELIKRVRDEAPRLPILVLSMHGESHIASRAIKAGASGYITKDSEPDTLVSAIRQVAKGARYIEPCVAERLVFDPGSGSDEAPHARLSDRENQVFLLLAQGRGPSDIAEMLHVSIKTISTHKFRIMQKLGFETVTDLVRYALKHGLV